MVGGIFPYQIDHFGDHDEITFELLSNDVVARRPRVLTNVYDDEPLGRGNPEFVPAPDLTSFHTYRIEWLPDKVRWLVDGRVVREASTDVPDEPMQLHLNFWAPGREWADAYSEALQPVSTSGANTSFFFDVDYAHVARLTAFATRPAGPAPSDISAIRDFDGNDLGASGDWRLLGGVDAQHDNDAEWIYVNPTIGRWATVGPDENGNVDFDNHSWGGDTRVVGSASRRTCVPTRSRL